VFIDSICKFNKPATAEDLVSKAIGTGSPYYVHGGGSGIVTVLDLLYHVADHAVDLKCSLDVLQELRDVSHVVLDALFRY
jgi:hypothetical protein